MTAHLLRFTSNLSPVEQALDEWERAYSYLEHVRQTGQLHDPEDQKRLAAAGERLDRAAEDYFRLGRGSKFHRSGK